MDGRADHENSDGALDIRRHRIHRARRGGGRRGPFGRRAFRVADAAERRRAFEINAQRFLALVDPAGAYALRDVVREPSLMYQPWLVHVFGVTLAELEAGAWSLSSYVAMGDFAKARAEG